MQALQTRMMFQDEKLAEELQKNTRLEDLLSRCASWGEG
jgi:hypothetical protein